MVDISDLPVPPKSAPAQVDISDLPAPPKKEEPRLPSMFTTAPEPVAEAKGSVAALRGLTSGVLGGAGALESMITPPGKGALKGKETFFPTPENVREGFSKLGFKEPSKELQPMQTAGELAPALAAGGSALYNLGKFGATKAADLAKSFRKPAAIAETEGLDVVGEKGFKLIKDKADKLYKDRSTEAEQKYDAAFDAARKTQAKGQPFATSPQGRSLLQQLENEKSVIAGGEKFAVGEEQIAGIDRLINAIKGKTVGGESVPVGKGLVSSKTTKKTPSETTEKDIKALVEELRFLRDVDAKGKPYEAYAGLSADYKRDLKAKLEQALHSWSDEYRLADEAYKAASQKLAPFRTELMSRALKGEKFDPKSMVKSPEEFGTTFFTDVDGVRQLKAVTQDPAAVSQLGKEYVASLLANKTPAQVKSFAKDAKNSGWMREAGINDAVQKYAQQTATAESRQDILKKLGYATVVGTVGYTAGRPLSRALGF
jgi:hypothetical protein